MNKPFLLLFLLLFLNSGVNAQSKIPITDSFEVKGEIKNPQTVSISMINGFPMHDLKDITTVNHLGKTMSVIHGVKGVLLKDVLKGIDLNTATPREIYGIYVVCLASDGYKTVFTWNEIFNSSRGDNIYIITEKEGKTLAATDDRIAILDISEPGKGHVNIKGLRELNIQPVK